MPVGTEPKKLAKPLVRGWFVASVAGVFLLSLPIVLPAASYNNTWFIGIGRYDFLLHSSWYQEWKPELAAPLEFCRDMDGGWRWTLRLGPGNYEVAWLRVR